MSDLTDLIHAQIPAGSNRIISLSEMELSLETLLFMFEYIFTKCSCCDGAAYHYRQERIELPGVVFHMVEAVKCRHCNEHGLQRYVGMN